MSIRELLAGLKPRTKTVTVGHDTHITLHEFTANERVRIAAEQAELDSTDAEACNRHAAGVICQAMLGAGVEVTGDDIEALLNMVSLDQIDELYVSAIRFNGMHDTAQENAQKNS